MALVNELRSDERLAALVDVFFFEHHVELDCMMGSWGSSVAGSVRSSLELFAALRRLGIQAHSWP